MLVSIMPADKNQKEGLPNTKKQKILKNTELVLQVEKALHKSS